VRLSAAVLMAVVLAGAGSAVWAARGRDSRLGRAERARTASLAAELAAARSHRLYLVLDPGSPAVELAADGLLLRRFPVERALFGRSRLAGGEIAWPAVGFTLASEIEEPERPRIPIPSAPAPAAAPGAAAPATATPDFDRARREAYEKAPTHYRLRFYPTLDISVLGEAGVAHLPGRLWRTRHRLVEGWEAVALALRGEPIPPRVVLYMTPDEARRLYVTRAGRGWRSPG
jgi:hypothetical protein